MPGTAQSAESVCQNVASRERSDEIKWVYTALFNFKLEENKISIRMSLKERVCPVTVFLRKKQEDQYCVD